jgi:hypothetical protein
MNTKKVLIVLAVTLISLYTMGQPGKSTETPKGIRAGIAKVDITPEKPVELYGYSARKAPSAGIHDRLYARAVVFDNNTDKIVLVSSDLGTYEGEAFTIIRKSILDKFHLKESQLFLSAIHSHSSPVLYTDEKKDNLNNVEFTKSLQQKLLSVIGEAFNNLKPVNLGTGVGYSPVGSNRREMQTDGSISLGRNPYGPTDKEVLVMKIASSDGAPVGAIFDYATHATSLGPDNLQVSGDVLGLAAQFVEKILGKDVVTPVFAGASGNIDPWYRILPGFNTEPGWIPEPVLLGTLLGEEVVHVFRDIHDLRSDGDIITSYSTIECRVRKSGENKNFTDDSSGKTIPVNITVARIGSDVAFVGVNVEMLTEIGMRIKSGSPFRHTFIITHCNGPSEYLAPAELYKEGGYEIESTPFGIGSADMVVKQSLRMLYDLK